jgi:hypothetical protein
MAHVKTGAALVGALALLVLLLVFCAAGPATR